MKSQQSQGMGPGLVAFFASCGIGLALNPDRDAPPKPEPYIAGQPGFESLDNTNFDGRGNRLTNEDKARIRDAILKLEAAVQLGVLSGPGRAVTHGGTTDFYGRSGGYAGRAVRRP